MRRLLVPLILLSLAAPAVAAGTGRPTIEPNPTAVVLSELLPRPARGGGEWVELANPSSVGEVLDGWTLENGRSRIKRLKGLIPPWGRAVFSGFSGNLRDGGDLVTLKDAGGRVIDRVAYGGWEKGLYASVPGMPERGEAVARLELSERWAVTSRPTPNAANVIEEKPVAVAVAPAKTGGATLHQTVQGAATGTPETAATQSDGSATSTFQAAVQKTATKKTAAKKTTAKKAPTALKAGERRYEGLVAVPPGVYAKTRLYVVLKDGTIKEARTARTPTDPPAAGATVSFIAKEGKDGERRWLAIRTGTLAAEGKVETPTYSATSTWPGAVAAVEITGAVVRGETGRLVISAGGREGAIILPSSAKPSYKAGDVVAARGYADPAGPALYLAQAEALALVKPASATTTAATGGGKKLPGPLAGGLTASVGAVGLLAYLRNERLKRLDRPRQEPPEDADGGMSHGGIDGPAAVR